MSTVPRDALRAETRRALESHDTWDSPHCFMTLHWDGTSVHVGTYAAILPDVAPPDYPVHMARLAYEELERDPGDPACAYLLQIEAHSLRPPSADAGEAELNRFHTARLTRTFYRQPDAEEAAIAWCADVHGRMWSATKYRSDPARIEEVFYSPGRTPGGQLITGLLAVAYATGTRAHGLPGPQRASN